MVRKEMLLIKASMIKNLSKYILFIGVLYSAMYADYAKNSISLSFHYDFLYHVVLLHDPLPYWVKLDYAHYFNENFTIKGGFSYHKRVKGNKQSRLAKQFFIPVTVNYIFGDHRSKGIVGLGGYFGYYKIPYKSYYKNNKGIEGVKQSSFGFYPVLETGYDYSFKVNPHMFFELTFPIIFDYHSCFLLILAPAVTLGYKF